MKKKSLLAPIVLIGLAACNNGGGSGSQLESSRGLLDPQAKFTAQKQAQKLSSLNKDEMAKVFRCDEPSTNLRLDKEKFTMSWEFKTRAQYLLDAPMVGQSYTKTYSTEDSGNTYINSFQMGSLSVGETNFVPFSGLSYNNNCTRSEGCDEKRRQYTAGSAIEWIRVSKQFEQARTEAAKKATSCDFTSAVDEDGNVIKPEQEITQGTVEIGGRVHNAVSIVETQEGSVSCDEHSGQQKIYVGEGQSVIRTIILADELPDEHKYLRGIGGADQFHPVNLSGVKSPCPRNDRTLIFSGMQVTVGGTIVEGSSNELAGYSINGEVQTVDEWEESKKLEEVTLKKLENDVRLAKANLRNATSAYDQAKTNANNLKSTADNLELTAKVKEDRRDQILNDPEATQEQKDLAKKEATEARNLAAEARARYELAQEQVEDAHEAKKRADVALWNAETALEQFKDEIEKSN